MPSYNLQLISKYNFNSNIVILYFSTTDSTEIQFQAGQFLSLEVLPKTYRSYSIFSLGATVPDYFAVGINSHSKVGQTIIGLMVNTKPGGVGSQYADRAEVGENIRVVGPAGKFNLVESSNSKNFVATSTGLAPFVPMIERIRASSDELIKVYFGVKDLEDNFATAILSQFDNLELNICSEDEFDEEQTMKIQQHKHSKTFSQKVLKGYVTSYIIEDLKESGTKANNDFYLCGNPIMIESVKAELAKLGGENNTFEEKYS
jgi:NAD(P)H-flavin reductase